MLGKVYSYVDQNSRFRAFSFSIFTGTRRYTVHADPVLTVDYNVKVRKSK